MPNSSASVRKRIFFMLTGVPWLQMFGCQMRIVTVLLECKVEGDRTDNEGMYQ